ncbi:MAG: hypothetical protein ACP6IQ_10585 [Candidatus Njordarchaeia archaeon]
MQLSDIRTAVRYRIREASASVWSDAELNQEINLAQNIVAMYASPDLLKELTNIVNASITIGQELQIDVTNYLRVIGDGYVNNNRYYYISDISEVIRIKNLSSADIDYQKKICYVYNKQLGFFPILSSSGTLYIPVINKPSDLSDDADISDLNNAALSYVIDLAAANALFKTEPQKALELKSQTMQLILGTNKK